MKEILFTFRSVTPAQQAERILHRAGIDCQLARTPKYLQEQGCGYSLRVGKKDAAQAAQLLHSGPVTFQKVYLMGEKGIIQELEL